MPGTQLRGTHAFDPSTSLPCPRALVEVNAEDDGEEDQLGPPLDTPIPNVPEAFVSAAISSFLQTSSSNATSPPSSSSISPSTRTHHIFPSELLQPLPNEVPVSQKLRVSVGSTRTVTTNSDTSSQKLGKRKHDATGDKRPSSFKRASKNNTDALNPVIISNALNSTLIRLADVMEKSLDATTTSVESQTTTHPPLTSQPSSTPSGTSSTPSSASASTSSEEVLDQALRIITADADKGLLSEDELLAASMLFTSTSGDVVRIGRNFIALTNYPAVRCSFIRRQLEDTGFLQGKGKGKARADANDIMM